MTIILHTPKTAKAQTAREIRKVKAWLAEHAIIGVLIPPAKGQTAVFHFRKQWLKERAQIAFVRGGKGARDAIYHPRSTSPD